VTRGCHMIVEFSQLMRMTRLKSRAAIRRYLEKRKIAYLMSRDGAPWTTTEAINRVLFPVAQPNLDACLSPTRRAALLRATNPRVRRRLGSRG
jgi:hypothetical protein